MDAQTKRKTDKLLVGGLIALAIVGATAQASSTETFSSSQERTYEAATSSYPMLRQDCHDLSGVVLHEWVQENWHENPRTVQAFVACQVDG